MTSIPLTIGVLTLSPILYPIASSIYSGIIILKDNVSSLFQKNDIILNSIIEKYDLIATLDIINSVIDTQKNNNTEYIITTMKYLNESILEVNNLLNQINTIINDHNNKWFSSWRSIDYKNEMDNLIISIDRMNNRYKKLIKLLPKH